MKALPAVERVALPLAALRPTPDNPRIITPAAKAGLKASLQKFGLVQEIVVNVLPDGTHRIVGGHQRVDALVAAGAIDAPCAVVRLGEADERALNLALNNPHIAGDWDAEALARWLEEAQAADASLFAALRLDELFAEAEAVARAGLTDPDDAPEPPIFATSRPGDLWLLGSHRLVCGDSTDAAVVSRLLGDVRPHLMVTDPPYGVAYDADWRNRAFRPSGRAIGGRAIGGVANDDRADWRDAWALFPGDVAYVWHAPGPHQVVAFESLVAADFEPRQVVVWVKQRFVIGRGNYHWQHESCWYAVRRDCTAHWNGDRTQSTVWQIEHRKSETGHSTQKPIECMRRPIENNSHPGDAVYEPFSGSGTTIIAGEQTGRRVYAVELMPAYVDVAVMRWQAFTGGRATLDGDGRTFDDARAARASEVA